MNDWYYCHLVRNNQGQMIMLKEQNGQIVFAHNVTQIIDLEPSQYSVTEAGVVS